LGDGQDPQDVEWVDDGRRLWLVQARPVTRLPRATLPAIVGLPALWSSANVKDNFGEPPSTLGWSLLLAGLSEVLFVALSEALALDSRGLEVARRIDGRPYFELGALQWAFYDGLGVRPAEINRTLGGRQPEIPVPDDRLERLRRAPTWLRN